MCADTIVGENMERFNEAEDERRTADLERSGDESEVKTLTALQCLIV